MTLRRGLSGYRNKLSKAAFSSEFFSPLWLLRYLETRHMFPSGLRVTVGQSIFHRLMLENIFRPLAL